MTQVFRNTKSKSEKNSMLRGKATLPLWDEPKHNYLGPALTDEFTAP